MYYKNGADVTISNIRPGKEIIMADLKYLKRLSRDYPNIKAASAEIINLKAILALPKGTGVFSQRSSW